MRIDRFGIGVVLGLIFPVFGFFGYGLIYTTGIRPHHDMHWFVHDLFLGSSEYRTRIVSLSLIADAFLFFAFDRFGYHKAMRGVITAMIAYGLYIVPVIAYEELSKFGWI
ncbi:MAG: hypothetical protein IPG74_15725 [Flavobacteriales bacterium]|nr:hypothetical protein [Flavobacteriales bacterium]